MLQLLDQISPGVKRVATLFNPDTAPGAAHTIYVIWKLLRNLVESKRLQRAPKAMLKSKLSSPQLVPSQAAV